MGEPMRAIPAGAQDRRRSGRGVTKPDDSGLDFLIERRAVEAAQVGSDPDERHEIWKESERRYLAQIREANRHRWITHYRTLAAKLRASAERLERKAADLAEPGKGGG